MEWEDTDDICAGKHGGNPESEEANAIIAGSKDATRHAIMVEAEAKGTHGIIADEIAAAWGVTHNHVSPRISELKMKGLLVPTEYRRLTRSGCRARVLITARVARLLQEANKS